MAGYWPLPWLQDALVQLNAAASADRLPHAMLFVGPEGVGKQSLALTFSKTLLCQRSDELACGVCDSCVQFESGSHPDFRHLAPDEKTGNFKIEAVRSLSQELALTSQYGGYRIAVLEGVEGFTEGASNALLKTLEEPPAAVLLMLLTPWPGRLMATIRSRCQQVRCPVPDEQLAVQWLQRHGVADVEAVLARVGGGPLLALEQSGGGELSQHLDELLPKVVSGKLGLAAAAKSLEGFHSRELAAAMLARLESEALQQSESLARGAEIACLGGRRAAQTVFALRDRIIAEHKLDPTGLNQQAALERLMMLVARGR
ncbi:MAG: DNA polymerase III subunit delta' [Granulosicoccaceae bacterium]